MLTMKPRETAIYGALIVLALVMAVLVSDLTGGPLTDEQRAEMIIDATEGLPQDR